jgi:Transposase DDE domain/Transposase domain (DUF772)
MFQPTPSQRPLFGTEHLVSEGKRARLQKTWAHQFRDHALPLIDEEQFRRFFHLDNGRPNKSVRLVVSVLVLKEVFDLTDTQALEQLEWNLAWHHAIDITPEEAHTCQKTLHNFRTLLLKDDEGAGLFEGTTARLIKAAELRTQRQRLDSTHIVSNIKLLTRLGLFVATTLGFLTALRKTHPRLCAKVPEELRARYLDREGYFADARSSEAPRRLEQSALDVYALVSMFREHKTISAMSEFGLLERLYNDQCVPPEVTSPERIELQKDVSSSSLQSPSDPDVTYGHKGKGYEVQLAETCGQDNPFEVVTAVDVNGANESDQHQLLPVLEQVERTCGAAPEKMHTDSGYASGANIVAAAKEHGTELLAPIGAKASEKHLPIAQFQFDAAGEKVVQCPAGQAPTEHRPSRRGTATLANFARETCVQCPLRGRCPTEERRGGRVLKFGPAEVATARRRVEQETPAFKEAHKIRSGIEATNSESKRCHGLGKPRVRRRPRVKLAVRLKILALNVKRYVSHLVEKALAATGPVPACAC